METALSGLVGAVIGALVASWGSYLVQRKLGTDTSIRQYTLTQISLLQTQAHRLSFRRIDLNNALDHSADEARRLLTELFENVSALQVPVLALRHRHPDAHTKVKEWADNYLDFVAGMIGEISKGTGNQERVARGLAFLTQRPGDFGLEDAMNALISAAEQELRLPR